MYGVAGGYSKVVLLCFYLTLPSPSLPSSMHLMQVDSVQRWMEDLKLMTDCECMCILQSKPISIEKDEQNELILSSQYNTCDNLQLLLKRAWIISTELTRIAQKLEKNRWQRVHSMTVRVNCHVHSMINEYNTFTRSSSQEMHQVRKCLSWCHVSLAFWIFILL